MDESDSTLDLSLAQQLGHVICQCGMVGNDHVHDPEDTMVVTTDFGFTTSLDALRDGPEALLSARGWQSFHQQVDGVYHWGWRRGVELYAADHSDEVEARAQAAHLVLERWSS